MNETIVEVLIMIAAFIGCLLFAALSAWKAAYDKRTWSLVKGRYVRMPIWNYMSFVALFSAMPIILLFDGCDIWAITAAALTTLILPCGLFGRRVELRGNELILRNEFWISHTVCIEDIQTVYEVGNLASSQIRFKVKNIKKPIGAATDTFNGLPELLLLIDQRCPGVVQWCYMPRMKKRMQLK